jgi:hypothetical protein
MSSGVAKAAFDDEARAWIYAHPTEYVPTEISIPLRLTVRPVFKYQPHPHGGFFASVDPLFDLDELAGTGDFEVATFSELISCDHGHLTKEEAWACGDELGRLVSRAIVERVMDRGDRG